MALTMLAEGGQVAADLPIECRIIESDADSAEIGLAENVIRQPMHPADQFEAFAGLIAKGSGIADVAARFGVSEAIVTKRMRLGRVSPKLLDAYREGEHAAQERVWEGFGTYGCNPNTIRHALTAGEISTTDKRVRCIGLDAYEAAGGAVRRDLFDDRNGGYILDTALLDRLVQQSLDAAAEELRAEGWGLDRNPAGIRLRGPVAI
jgi:ParB family chromosome partitioning protein